MASDSYFVEGLNSHLELDFKVGIHKLFGCMEQIIAVEVAYHRLLVDHMVGLQGIGIKLSYEEEQWQQLWFE